MLLLFVLPQAEVQFATMDENGGGTVLFDEFCTWIASVFLSPTDHEYATYPAMDWPA